MKYMLQTDRGVPLSEAVIEAVADEKDVEPIELEPPLSSVIDADALNNLLANETTGCIVFEYSGCEVTVQSDHTVEVREQSKQRPNFRQSP